MLDVLMSPLAQCSFSEEDEVLRLPVQEGCFFLFAFPTIYRFNLYYTSYVNLPSVSSCDSQASCLNLRRNSFP